MTPEQPRIARVSWTDSATIGRQWIEVADMQLPHILYAAGFVARSDAQQVTVCSAWDADNGTFAGCVVIPRVVITDLEDVRP